MIPWLHPGQNTLSHEHHESTPVRLFGDGPNVPVGPKNGIGDLVVSKSGESILFTPRGDQNQPLPVASIRSSDDVQVLQVAGVTQGPTCTLTLGAATTAPIPLQPMPPVTSFIYRANLPSAGKYDLGVTWSGYWGGPWGSRGTSRALFEVFESGKRVGSATLDQSVIPGSTSSQATDVAVQGSGVFRLIGTFDLPGKNLEIRLSGDPDPGMLLAGTVRVAPTGSSDPAAVGFINPAPWSPPGAQGVLDGAATTVQYGAWTRIYFSSSLASSVEGYLAAPTGTQGTGFFNASDVQQALLALAVASPGSVLAAPQSNQSMSVRFTEAMGGQPWPTLTCSDPAIRVVHDGTAGSSIGGDYPTATVNGVVHDLKAISYAVGKPSIAFHLIQDAPAVQYLRYCEGLFQLAGWCPVQEGVGFGGRVGYPGQAGPLANWRFQGLAGPADFQVDVTWPGGDEAGDTVEFDILDGSGRTLATATGVDQSKAPGDSVDAAGVTWKLVGRVTLPLAVNSLTVQARGAGTPGKHAILDSARLTRISPDRGVKIRPGDSVLFRMPTDFVRTSSGSVPAVSGVPVSPALATRLPAIPAAPKSMKLGYNCDFPVYFGVDSCYANMAIQAKQPFGLARDGAGNPTRLAQDPYGPGGTTTALVTIAPLDGGRGYGVPTCGPGVWVLQWTGSPWCSCTLEPTTGSTGIAEIFARRVTNGKFNRRYYRVTTSSPAPPQFQLRYRSSQANGDGTYQCDATSLAIYPPEVDPDSPPKWRPGFLKKLRGVQCFRFMDWLGTNNLNLSEFSHLPDQANFPLGYFGREVNIPVASIGPPEADPFSEAGGGTVVRVTTKVPHGLASGFIVGLQATDGSSLGQVASNLVDPKTGGTTSTPRDALDPTDGYQGRYVRNFCRVVDATTLQIGIENYGGPLARMTNTLTPANAVVNASLATHALAGPDDIADLCIATGLEGWVNVPWLATDDCVARMAAILAARLPRGRAVHVEYGNEPWNAAFPASSYCSRMARLAGWADTSYVPYYMTRMARVHQMFRDAWAAQGRDPAEVRRVCGVQQEWAGGSTVPSIAFAIAHGIRFDEVAAGSYYSNGPAVGPLDDLLTREQILDLFAMNVQQSDLPAFMAAHLQACRDALAQNPTQAWLGDVVLVNYEGGPDTMTTSTMTANIAARNHGVHRHPDFCEIQLHQLQMLEDAGVKLFNIFSLYGTRDVSQWGVYEAYDMEAGTGDASIDLANVDDFENLDAIKSTTAAALLKWSALIGQPAPPTPSAGRKPRNGRLLTYGMSPY